ncbi:hypothetical protein IAU59_001547 [Kwoniella sp. CBS 9459]
MSSRSPSPSSSPHTPPPGSPQVRVTLPTPPSFLAHRSRSSEGMERRHSSNSITSATVFSEHDEVDELKHTTQQAKRLSISSIHDPIVEDGDKRNRRVSFSNETKIISRPVSLKPASQAADGTEDGGLKSPVYRIPQRQNSAHGAEDNDAEETLASPQTTSRIPSTPSSANKRPLSFQGLGSPSSTSPSRFASTAAARGISIAPALSKGGAFRSIWSAGIIPSSSSGWISPAPALASANAKPPRSAKTPTTPNSIKSPVPGSAAELAKQRGLSIAILKEDGQGVLPITPGLATGTSGLKSPLGGVKSPELKVLRGLDSAALSGLTSAKSTGVPDTGGSGSSRKEIILCKFYHTPGLTCTSRPCRFVHNLSSIGITTGTGVPSSALLTASAMLSPRQTPDPTSGTFAQAQMRPPANTGKTIRLREGEDLSNVMPGERVVVEDENGQEVVGQIFMMSGGGKGAMGKSREKWKTVPCKDFADGHCPYGDYCSFIHDEKPSTVNQSEEAQPNKADKPADANKTDSAVSARPGHRKSASMGSSLNAWTKALPRVQLVSSVKVDPEVLKKKDNSLSAFAAPFSKQPVAVDNAGEIVPALLSPKPLLPSAEIDSEKLKAKTPPARAKEPLAIPMAPTPTAPPKSNAWSKGPPPTLRKVASLKKVTITDTEPSSQLATIPDRFSESGELKTPTSASHLMPPVSAFSMFGTESDPASPFDPVVQRRKMQELEDALTLRQNALPRSNLSQAISFDVGPISPSGGYPRSPTPSATFNSSTYPWGMPMSPVFMPGYQDPAIPNIRGGLGVMWTPAGWAVQDAAMKSALRTAEVKTKFGEETRRRQAKNYFRTRPCKFFMEGFCPHGEECTYMHMVSPPSPDQTASSDSGSFSPSSKPSHLPMGMRHPKHQTLPCKFFNSAMGCMNGDTCTFLHTRVVPESVPLVERPRPWRTKPCRHFQLGRCTLGDACHFAHVPDPAWLASGGSAIYGGPKEDRPCPSWKRTGRCPDGNGCRLLHLGEGGEGNLENLTEDGLQKTLEEMREKVRRWNEEDEEDDDDVEIVTGMSSSSYSPSSSIKA